MSEKRFLQKRLQQLIARENSTLVLSTVASSLSLALLVGLVTNNVNELIRNALFLSGLLFVLFGYSYRELTIHVADFEDSEKLCLLPKVRENWRKKELSEKFCIALRMWLVRFFLLIPFVPYVVYGCVTYSWLTFPKELMFLIVAIVALMFTLFEMMRVYDP
ncbi:hypothetical protein HXY33_04545 [Candidatus Bathyarchaeota archaeon]|nr:hypothetical protein [Candidatus Bathyarchaeota archaeon]